MGRRGEYCVNKRRKTFQFLFILTLGQRVWSSTPYSLAWSCEIVNWFVTTKIRSCWFSCGTLITHISLFQFVKTSFKILRKISANVLYICFEKSWNDTQIKWKRRPRKSSDRDYLSNISSVCFYDLQKNANC